MPQDEEIERVREWYRAMNREDIEALVAAYHEDAVQEQLDGHYQGRAENRRMLEAYFSAFAGAFDDGAHVRLRSLTRLPEGRIYAEWIGRERRRDSGELVLTAGYSEFLLDNGRIRHQRGAVHPVSEIAEEQLTPSPRRYPQRPIVGVGAVILVDERIVIVKRAHEPLAGQWSLPGGTIELGETLEAGVRREMLEETGLAVDVGPVVEVFDRILLDEDQKVRYHFVLIDYLCRATGGRLTPGSDVLDAKAVLPSELEPYKLTPKALSVIARGLELAQLTGE
jgi:8-oxo-dGTP diphosphatase